MIEIEGVAARKLGQFPVLISGMRSFETAERDDEEMAFKIRLERGNFPVVSIP